MMMRKDGWLWRQQHVHDGELQRTYPVVGDCSWNEGVENVSERGAAVVTARRRNGEGKGRLRFRCVGGFVLSSLQGCR